MRISLKDFGGFLSSPDLGKRIAVSILDAIRKEPDNNVIIDFSGVQGVNKHFCEELLTFAFRGVGYEEFRKKVIMQNQAAVVKLVFDSVMRAKKDIPVEGIDVVIGEPIHTVHFEKAVEEQKVVEPAVPVMDEKKEDRPVVVEKEVPASIPEKEKVVEKLMSVEKEVENKEEELEAGKSTTVKGRKPKKKEATKRTVAKRTAKTEKSEKKKREKTTPKVRTSQKKAPSKRK